MQDMVELQPGRIRIKEALIFVAIANVHYPILELIRVQYSYGLLPLQLGLIVALALATDRVGVVAAIAPYVATAILYFAVLSVLAVDYYALGAYVVVMQTATAIAFGYYLLSLGPEGARAMVRSVQRMLGIYIAVFAVMILAIRAGGDVTLYNQVAQSNYLGLLTTYVILAIIRRPQLEAGGRGTIVTGLLANILGGQRSSLLINIFTTGRRIVSATIVMVAMLIVTVSGLFIWNSGVLEAILQPVRRTIAAYIQLAPLAFDDLRQVITVAIATPDAAFDASVLLRVASMLYVASRVIESPLAPVVGGEYDHLINSHNVVLEFFKVGGLVFVVLSFVMLLRPYRHLLREGYFGIDLLGVVLTFVYSFLFNDLFLGFLLLPLSLRGRGGRVDGPYSLAKSATKQPAPALVHT